MIISIVIPVYNEKKTIRKLLESVERACNEQKLGREIIVVDDASTDGTTALLRQLSEERRIRLLVQEKNGGKGTAVRRGIAAATGDIVLIQDADLEYSPDDYPVLLKPILAGNADVVYGSRFLGMEHRVLLFWHTLGNKLITFFSNMFTNLNLTDVETCYKAFRREIIQNIHLECRKFDFEIEVTVKVAKMKCRIYEVPISYNGRTYEEGKKIRWYDGIDALKALLKYTLCDNEDDEHTAYAILQKMDRLKRYNAWLFGRIAPYIGNRVLEAGSSTGNITRYLADKEQVICTDSNRKYLLYLKNRYEQHTNIEVTEYDLETPPAAFAGRKIDTVLCMNVLEHMADDDRALRNMYSILEPGGKAVLLVPALKALYGSLDRNLGHHRRYEKKELAAKLEAAGFRIVRLEFSNMLAVPGWYVNARVLKRTRMTSFQARIFDHLVPLLKIESFITPRFGLSIVAVAEKKQ